MAKPFIRRDTAGGARSAWALLEAMCSRGRVARGGEDAAFGVVRLTALQAGARPNRLPVSPAAEQMDI